MQYEIEVIHRNSPSHRFTLTITVETDMKWYLATILSNTIWSIAFSPFWIKIY